MTADHQAQSHQHHTDDPVGLVLHNPIRYNFRVWLTTRGREGKFRRTLVELAGVKPGDSVLDVGCGTGSLAIEAGKMVGPTGSVVGIDPSPEMIGRAKGKARRLANVRFEIAPAQSLPFADASFDVVTSSLVLHQLPPDSLHAVKAEVARVLKPGGRIGISDVVAEDRLTPEQRALRGSYVGCIAGALSKAEYEAGLEAAGFDHVSVEFTHEVADGMHGAIVKAVKADDPRAKGLPVIQAAAKAGCC